MPRKSTIPVHHLPTKQSEEPLRVFGLGAEDAEQYNAREPHRHNYYEIFIFNKGGGTHRIDFSEHLIENNSIHLIAPGQIHMLKRDKQCRGTVLVFTEAFCVQAGLHQLLDNLPFYSAHGDIPVIKAKPADMDALQLVTEQLKTEQAGMALHRQESVLAWLNLLLVSLSRISSRVQTNRQTAGAGKGTDLVKRFNELVQKNYIEQHDVKSYASELAVTPGHLNDTIKKHLGISAGTVIHERQLLEAKRLLFHTEWSVKEIAHHLRFEDPAYFARFFRRMSGAAPQAFREKIREKYR